MKMSFYLKFVFLIYQNINTYAHSNTHIHTYLCTDKHKLTNIYMHIQIHPRSNVEHIHTLVNIFMYNKSINIYTNR